MKIFKYIILCIFAAAGNTTECFGQTENLRDSLKTATEILAYHPDSTDLRLKKVNWNIRLAQWQYAKDDLDKILYRQPANPAALFYRAYVNEQLRRYNFARLDYRNLLTIVPGHYEGMLGLALLNQKDKHYTEALDQINLLVQMYPDSASAYAARAGIERERGMKDLAIFDYEKAVAIAPKDKDILLDLATLYAETANKEKAAATLRRLQTLGVPRGQLIDLYKKIK